MEMAKKMKIAIAVLAVLLAVSLLSLSGVFLVRYFSGKDGATVTVPDNEIGPGAGSGMSGGLADVLTVTVMDGDETLYAGSVAGLTRENVSAAKDALGIGQRRNLTVYFSFPEESGNEMQKNDLTFTVCAEATQTKNNPDRLFD